MRFRGVTEEGKTIEFKNYCKDSDIIIEYGSDLGVYKGIWRYIKKDTLVCLEVEALERQLAEARKSLGDSINYRVFNLTADEAVIALRRAEQLKEPKK